MKDPKEYLKDIIELPIQNSMQSLESILNEINTLATAIPDTLQVFPSYLKSLDSLSTRVANINFDVAADRLIEFVSLQLQKEVEDAQVLFTDKTEDLMNRVNAKVEELQNANKAFNASLYSEVDDDNAIFNQLKYKQAKLMEYREVVTDLCTRYDITATDVNIDESTLKPEVLDKLYTEFLKYLSTSADTVNPVTKLKEKLPDLHKQGLVVLVLFILCFTPLLTIVSILFVVGSVYAIKTQGKKVKYYSVLQALLYNVNPDKLAHSVVDESRLLPEVIELSDSDNYPELKCFEDEMDDIVEKYDPENTVEKDHIEYMAKFEMIKPEMYKTVEDGRTQFESRKREVTLTLEELKKKANAAYEKLKNEYKGFGFTFTTSATYDTRFTFGINNFVEEYVDIGDKNIIIRPGRDKNLLKSFIRCLFVNAYTKVNFTKVNIHVIDPNGMGQAVMPFYTAELATRFNIVQNNPSDTIDKYTDIAQKNFELMQGSTIREYNKKCEELDRDPIPYHILFILSQPKELEEDEKLSSLFQYSATAGIFIWVVSDNMIPTESTYLFQEPFAGVRHPIKDQDDRDWCGRSAHEWVDKIEEYKPPTLDWTKFIAVACPLEKQWTFNADDNMYMYPGFQNGDPSLCSGYPLGNGGNVHALAVGTTGAGKSIFIHHMVQTMCEMYSPRELQLWLCDFKGTEFKFYMASETFPYTLPHIKACLCTADGDYATSLFHALRVITDNRFEQMKNPNDHREWLKYDDGEPIPNFDNSKNWNRYWRERAKQKDDDRYIDNCYPRIVLLADEFQVIFGTASPKNLDVIKDDMTQIAKLGRAASVHMFFTSQSMKGTLSADILNQFSLRFALRCTADVSMDIMGTPYAAENLPRFGGLYVSATGIKKEDQPKFATPNISTDTIHDSTKILAERAVRENMPKNDLITYEEATKHFLTELDEWYDKLDADGKLPEDANLMLIGDRMAYSENRAPDNFIMGKKNNENIMSVFTDYTDLVYFYRTLLTNIGRNKQKGLIIVNSQVEDISYITDAENTITNKEMHGDLINTSCKEFVNWMSGLYKSREESGKDSPVYLILIGWDKGTNFGVDTDIQLRGKFNALAQQCGIYNIHIIMINLGMVGISPSTVNAFKYCIAGKCSQDDSIALIGTKQAGMSYEMKTGWVFVKKDGEITRDKLYISEITREIAATELVL